MHRHLGNEGSQDTVDMASMGGPPGIGASSDGSGGGSGGGDPGGGDPGGGNGNGNGNGGGNK